MDLVALGGDRKYPQGTFNAAVVTNIPGQAASLAALGTGSGKVLREEIMRVLGH